MGKSKLPECVEIPAEMLKHFAIQVSTPLIHEMGGNFRRFQ